MKTKLYAIGLFLLAFVAISCNKDEPDDVVEVENLVSNHSNEVIVKWNEVFLDVERFAAGYRPGPAPRAIALIGLANYEACLSGMPSFNSVSGLYPGLSIPQPDPSVQYHWPTVINASYAYLMAQFFPSPRTELAKIELLENYYVQRYNREPAFEASRAYGKAVAQAVWDWSKTDSFGHDAYKDPFGIYSWQDNFKKDGNWRPTAPGGRPMFPNWGKVRTFAIKESDKLCPPPIPYSTQNNSLYYTQALEVYVESGPSTQTAEGKWIGEFWSDDLVNLTFSPGPRWLAIANQVYLLEKCNLETAVFANVKVGMALNDAAVACWHSKYYYNVERPATYIQKVIDPNYKSALNNPLTNEKGVTPSFPAYPSGHSTMGGAAAEALSSVFGYSYPMTDRCHEGRSEFVGKPRSFYSFYDMAQENAISRVPLGVHFRMDCEQGVALGIRCGRKVNQLSWRK